MPRELATARPARRDRRRSSVQRGEPWERQDRGRRRRTRGSASLGRTARDRALRAHAAAVTAEAGGISPCHMLRSGRSPQTTSRVRRGRFASPYSPPKACSTIQRSRGGRARADTPWGRTVRQPLWRGSHQGRDQVIFDGFHARRSDPAAPHERAGQNWGNDQPGTAETSADRAGTHSLRRAGLTC